MARKVRHPYQVLEASEMAAGQLYAFIHAHKGSNDSVSNYTMGGVFGDSHAAARRLGHDLDSAGPPKVEMLLAAPGAGPIVTVHMDGWRGGDGMEQNPTLMYWRECLGRDTGWDMLSSYLGPAEWNGDTHHAIVVPSQRWADDPRLHVSSWSDPDGVVERALIVEDAAGWERRMRAKAHAAMAKALGF